MAKVGAPKGSRKGIRPPAAGRGRVKGEQNKITRALKDMILNALEGAGGEAYLIDQAKKSPAAFMTLLGKIIPTQLEHSGSIVTKPEEMTEEQLIARRAEIAAALNAARGS